MQKQLSKHSLLVLTLSILLAVSMCLTITFAAFQSSQNITGTVSFSGGVEMTVNGASGALSSQNINFDVDMNDATAIDYTGGLTEIGFSAGGANFYWKVTLTIPNTTYIEFNTGATAADIAMGSVTPTIANNTITWTSSAVTSATLDVDGMLADLPIILKTAAIGSASSAASLDASVTATLTASAALNANDLT